jgi:ADP-heptose:LPS heptosyltransferase
VTGAAEMKKFPMKKILVIRNDKIGDFMLAWPALALLKKQYPDSEVTALVPAYTAPLAEICQSIDHILIDERQHSLFNDIPALVRKFRTRTFDVSISLFSQTRTSLALYLSGIKNRTGPATKIAQVFLNDRLKQRRSRSAKPEFEYNLDLVKHFIQNQGDPAVTTPGAPYLVFDSNEIASLRQEFCEKHAVDPRSRLVIIHAGHGGSANNLSLDQYAKLARAIARPSTYLVLTAGPGEHDIAHVLSRKMADCNHCIHESSAGLVEFAKFIAACDMFIGGSTGPLHIAGAVNILTAAFYPARQSATALRWKTINEESKQLTFSSKQGDDMNTIDLDQAASRISALLDNKIPVHP